jgi:hypothetical protein
LRRQAYLFELLNIDIELAAKLSFGMRERGHLGAEGTASGSFILRSPALFLVLGSQALDFGILTAQKSLVVRFAYFKLFADGLDL